jgi:hypothetical protein
MVGNHALFSGLTFHKSINISDLGVFHMSVIITMYHVAGVLAGFIAILGLFVKYLTLNLRGSWQLEITQARESIEKKRDKELDNLREQIDRECSTEALKGKIRDFVEGEIKVMEGDVRQIKEITVDLKKLLNNQQETLIAIQMSITELKPRITSLEKRVAKLEENR